MYSFIGSKCEFYEFCVKLSICLLLILLIRSEVSCRYNSGVLLWLVVYLFCFLSIFYLS